MTFKGRLPLRQETLIRWYHSVGRSRRETGPFFFPERVKLVLAVVVAAAAVNRKDHVQLHHTAVTAQPVLVVFSHSSFPTFFRSPTPAINDTALLLLYTQANNQTNNRTMIATDTRTAFWFVHRSLITQQCASGIAGHLRWCKRCL